MKTYGKHQVPMLSEGENGEEYIVDGKGRSLTQPDDDDETKSVGRRSTSALNKIALLNSPTVRKNVLLQPSSVKLAIPPTALLNGTKNEQNIHKSASTPSLRTKHLIGKNDEQTRSDLDRTVPNAAQMLLAARAWEKQTGMASPRALGARLPPLQLPKGPKVTEEENVKRSEKNGNSNRKQDEGQGMIATVPTRPLPQLQPLEQSKNTIANSAFSQSLPPPPCMATDDLARSSVSLPIPSNIANVPNEVLVHLQNPPRRRPSSAGAITTRAHKPLPAISAQIGGISNGMLSRGGNFAKHHANRIQWGTTVKCALIGGFFSVPVLIFALMLLLSSDGFSSHSDVHSSTSQSPAASSTTTAPTLSATAPTDVNIVGGAIFQPISMQNASVINK